MAYEYTPYTSELLDSGNAVVTDFTEFTGIGNMVPQLPTGKQVIFFAIGMVCVITSLGIMSRTLIADSIPGLSALSKLT